MRRYILRSEFCKNSGEACDDLEFGARSEAVSWSTHGRRGGISGKIRCLFRKTLQRYGEHLPFSKFFCKKIIKKVHFFRFGAVLRVRIVIIRNGQGL